MAPPYEALELSQDLLGMQKPWKRKAPLLSLHGSGHHYGLSCDSAITVSVATSPLPKTRMENSVTVWKVPGYCKMTCWFIDEI